MKFLLRFLALFVAVVSSIFTAQWAVRRFHNRSHKYFTFTINEDEISR